MWVLVETKTFNSKPSPCQGHGHLVPLTALLLISQLSKWTMTSWKRKDNTLFFFSFFFAPVMLFLKCVPNLPPMGYDSLSCGKVTALLFPEFLRTSETHMHTPQFFSLRRSQAAQQAKKTPLCKVMVKCCKDRLPWFSSLFQILFDIEQMFSL